MCYDNDLSMVRLRTALLKIVLSHQLDTTLLSSVHGYPASQHKSQIRDAKGVPAATPTFRHATTGSSSAPIFTSVTPMITDTYTKSRPHLEHWTSFGSAPSRFTANVDRGRVRPRRALDKLSLQADDIRSLGSPLDVDDTDSSRLPLGTRQDSQSFTNSRGLQGNIDTTGGILLYEDDDFGTSSTSRPAQQRSTAGTAKIQSRSSLNNRRAMTVSSDSEAERGDDTKLQSPVPLGDSSRKTKSGKSSKQSRRNRKEVDTPSFGTPILT
eukprot:Lankesteria_metandrocarpae@DN4826_c0_g1_i2.p2